MPDPQPHPALDWLILTAANRAQARGYRAQLHAREKAGALRACRRWLVLPDARDRRIGSGGSTFAALFDLARRLARLNRSAASLAELFAGQRILIIHSGGDSRRLPAYAAQGKIFTPLPCDTRDGREADLFDLVLEDLIGITLPESGRVLIASGDVMLGIARHRPRVDARGVVGVAFPTDLERGSRHGVFVCDPLGHVTDFLQKPTPQASQAQGATDAEGRVLVDTGLVSLDPQTVESWLHAAGATWDRGAHRPASGNGILDDLLSGRGGGIDLYHHILRALPSKILLDAYLDDVAGAGIGSEPERERCTKLFQQLHGSLFSVSVVPDCDFLHIGTSRELLTTVGGDRRIHRDAGKPGRLRAYNSDLGSPPKSAGPLSIIEGSASLASWQLHGDNIVVGVPETCCERLRLPRGWGLVCLPIGRSDWAVVSFGDRDDGKTRLESGGTLGNRPLTDTLRRARIAPGEVWSGPGTDYTLWTARLWPVAPINQALRDTIWMSRGETPSRHWRRAPRFSIAELLPRVNHDRMIAQRRELQRRDRIARVAARLVADLWLSASDIAADIQTSEEAGAVLSAINTCVRATSSPLAHARYLRLAALIRDRAPKATTRVNSVKPANFNAEAFAAVACAVAGEIHLPTRPPEARTLPDQVVWVTTPVRIDFHGGWSDTPPVCHELGGRVVNGAITLNGQYPVQVMSRLSDQPRIRISSVDLGASVTLTSAAQACAFSNPHDWAALAKAAIVLSGIAPSKPGINLKRWLEKFGGGLDLTIFAALPKGSGLGTSSVLGAAILAGLDRIRGREVSIPSLIERTSLLEQMMSTAGGWQDQAGGITPGVKLLRTEPGRNQVPDILRAPFDSGPGSPLAGRMLLYYTGYRRLARDILQNVVAGYLARDARTLSIIHRLKAGAEQMHADLESGDVEAFARGIGDFWSCKKAIDSGATNPRIEAIIRPIRKHLSGFELPGAGGGGFIFMIARDPEAAAAVRAYLMRRPPNRLARFYDFAIDQKGIAVSVL